MEPADQSAILGHQVVITCQADGFPQPSVVWKQAIGEQTGEYRELSFASSGGSSSSSSASMSNGPSLQTFSNGTLSIQNVTRHNQGDYLCQANNGIGAGLSKLIRLTVHVGPQVLLRNKQVSVRRGETINLHCEADGDKPLTVTWRAKGQRIDSTYDVRYQINTNPLNKGISSELTISQTTLSDRGEYSCIAANAFGTDHSTVHLQVQEPPSFPRNLHVTQLKADSVHLMWTPGDQDSSAFQPVTNYIVQYKEAEDTWRNNNHKKVVAGDKTDAFIDSLKPATNYHFRIYAENHLGTSAASDILNVIMGKPPDLIHYCTPLPNNRTICSPCSSTTLSHCLSIYLSLLFLLRRYKRTRKYRAQHHNKCRWSLWGDSSCWLRGVRPSTPPGTGSCSATRSDCGASRAGGVP